jgi:hypothetical protein
MLSSWSSFALCSANARQQRNVSYSRDRVRQLEEEYAANRHNFIESCKVLVVSLMGQVRPKAEVEDMGPRRDVILVSVIP